MALPKIETLSFEVVLPISKEKVKFRPYTVNEEKMLFIKKDLSFNEYKETVKDIIKACILEGNYPKYLVDLIFLFNHIRAKARGEVFEAQIFCENCKQQTPIAIDIIKALKLKNFDEKKDEKIVKVNDQLTITLETVKSTVLNEEFSEDETILDMTYKVLKHSVKNILFNGKVFSDFTPEEFETNILNNLLPKEFEILIETVDNMPFLEYEYEVKCIHCGHSKVEREGDISLFFGY